MQAHRSGTVKYSIHLDTDDILIIENGYSVKSELLDFETEKNLGSLVLKNSAGEKSLIDVVLSEEIKVSVRLSDKGVENLLKYRHYTAYDDDGVGEEELPPRFRIVVMN